jgi:hypothetical protein
MNKFDSCRNIKPFKITLRQKMDPTDKEKIKESVRESYAKVAKAGGVSIKSSMAASCCGPTDTSADTNVAASCCGGSEVTAEQMSAVMGYSNEEIASVIEDANICCFRLHRGCKAGIVVK